MKKYDNFCAAYQNLLDVQNLEPPYNNVTLTGMVALYEICFEQSWKAMKELLENSGFSNQRTGSPRQVLKTAYEAGMIRDEDLWLGALKARNNVAHAYNPAIAMDIVNQTKTVFIAMFHELKEELAGSWLD